MKTIKKLQIATAAASLFAGVGIANAAIVNSSGTTLAQETVFPATALARTAIGNLTNVRAPTFTYSYEGGVNAPASGVQHFSIVAALPTGGEWTLQSGNPDPLVATMSGVGSVAATTISASLRGVGLAGRRVAVVGTEGVIPNLQFAIVLDAIELGNSINGIAAFPVNSTNPTQITYRFRLVNKTTSPVNLSALDLTFNTFKSAAPPQGDSVYVAGSAQDTQTNAVPNVLAPEFASIYQLGSKSGETSCLINPEGIISLQVYSGEGASPFVSAEPLNSGVGGTNSNTILNYLAIRRSTQITVAPAPSRLVQTTNSFQTNLGTTPINGIGGTGGGRFTFKPSSTTVTNTYGGPTNGNWVVTGTAPLNANTGVIATQGGVAIVGTFPVRTTSGDERSANLGTISFSNTGNQTLDRNVDVDPYGFSGSAAPLPPFFGPTPSGSGRHGDLSTPAQANVYGGVDAATLQIRFTSKPGRTGFAAGSALRLNRAATVCPAPGAPDTGLPGVLVEESAGNYVWSFAASDLAGPTDTLLGSWTICYSVPGTTTIPAATFTNVTATLTKDEFRGVIPTEQSVVSCPSTFASVYGGVKIDVRNFQMQGVNGIDTNWVGILRVINNSETDVAAVEAQYIHNSGAYGKWGTIIPALAPRASQYVTDGAILAALTTNVRRGVAGATAVPVNDAPVTDATVRIRVSADVPTLRVQNYVFNKTTGALTEVSSSQGADFVNVESSNRDHIDQDAQTDIVKEVP